MNNGIMVQCNSHTSQLHELVTDEKLTCNKLWPNTQWLEGYPMCFARGYLLNYKRQKGKQMWHFHLHSTPFLSRTWLSFSISLVLAWDSCSNFSSIWIRIIITQWILVLWKFCCAKMSTIQHDYLVKSQSRLCYKQINSLHLDCQDGCYISHSSV